MPSECYARWPRTQFSGITHYTGEPIQNMKSQGQLIDSEAYVALYYIYLKIIINHN